MPKFTRVTYLITTGTLFLIKSTRSLNDVCHKWRSVWLLIHHSAVYEIKTIIVTRSLSTLIFHRLGDTVRL